MSVIFAHTTDKESAQQSQQRGGSHPPCRQHANFFLIFAVLSYGSISLPLICKTIKIDTKYMDNLPLNPCTNIVLLS